MAARTTTASESPINPSGKERRLGQPSRHDGWEAVTPWVSERFNTAMLKLI